MNSKNKSDAVINATRINQAWRISGFGSWQRVWGLSVGIIVLSLGLSLGLSACGFHLKGYNGGDATANFTSAKLDIDGTRREVYRALERYLKESDVKVVENLADAEVVIRLGATGYQTSPTSKDANGDTSSELIKMTQGFVVQQVATEKQVVQATVNSFRNRNVDPNQAQASHRELKSIEKQMAFELASQILDRINRAYAQMPAVAKDTHNTAQPAQAVQPAQ